MAEAGTIVWNGPVGVFEFDAFADGHQGARADAIAKSSAFSIAGGGDTIAAINKYGIADRISYISTAGGAFLEFLEGKTLPAVAVLEQRARRHEARRDSDARSPRRLCRRRGHPDGNPQEINTDDDRLVERALRR